MNKTAIEEKAKELRGRVGGTIFSFPINETDPFSKYAVAVYTGSGYNIYPEPLSIEEAAAGVYETLKGFKSIGLDDNYERNVRFVSYDAQMDAPNVTMRRLKKENVSRPLLKKGADVMENPDDPEGYLFSSRGLLKWTYIEMMDNKTPKAIQFMEEYYKMLAGMRYGKTAAAIKQEVRRLSKEEAIAWIEKTHARYVKDGSVIIGIMQRLK